MENAKIKVTVCGEKTLCVDCTETCWNAGDKVADCPRYPQTCKIRQQIDSCDGCTWIDKYIDEVRNDKGK